MDRIVISSGAPSSPSPRAHKSSRSAVTSERPPGPGWHSVFHYILVSLAERHNPTAFLYFFFLSRISSWCMIYAQKRKATRCFVLQRCRALWLLLFIYLAFAWKPIFKWLLYLQHRPLNPNGIAHAVKAAINTEISRPPPLFFSRLCLKFWTEI